MKHYDGFKWGSNSRIFCLKEKMNEGKALYLIKKDLSFLESQLKNNKIFFM
jgi:hypothetical protein